METSVEQILRRQKMKKFATGFVVVMAGLLLLAFNFELLPMGWRHIFFSWQMLLIVIGLISLFKRDGGMAGYILIFIGGFFLIPEIFVMHISFFKLFWPFLLIGIGLMILSKGGWGERWKHRHDTYATVLPDEGIINETNIFSGSKHKVTNQVFRGGKVTNIFGGTEIDLTQAILPDGQTELSIDCLFGGVTLLVPDDWKVVINVTAIMGGFSDKRLVVKEAADPNKVLIVRGSAIFGGGEIKCC